jgi:hypothetical protein
VLSAEVAEVVLAARGIEVEGRTRTSQSTQALELPPLQEKLTASREAAAASGDGADPVDPLLAAGVHPEGKGWPDALAASVLGSRQLAPVLLTPSDRLHPDVARVLATDGIRTARLVGGSLAMAPQVEQEIRDQTGRTTRRLSGGDRYATSQAVQEEIRADGASMSTLSVATGLNFPDALAAGPAMAMLNRSFVLVDGNTPNPGVQAWVSDHADLIDRLEVIGGSHAIADSVLRQTAVAANGD